MSLVARSSRRHFAGATRSTAAHASSGSPDSPTAPRLRPARAKPARPRAADAVAIALTCPRCQTGTLITGARGWGCGRWRDGCRFVVWFETAGRALSAAQLRDLVTRGKTRKATFAANGAEIAGRLVLDVAIDGGARLEPA